MDLFFYRDPEEAKEQEEEEVAAAPDFGAVDYTGPPLGLSADQWPGQVAETQWSAEVAAPLTAIPPAGTVDWNGAPGI